MNYRVSKFANFREKAEFLLEEKDSDSFGIKSLVQTLFATEIFTKWNACTNMRFQCTARSKNDYSLILNVDISFIGGPGNAMLILVEEKFSRKMRNFPGDL